ncbi:non-structural maintenance of chromosomes element 1 homolog [Amborella trichopoda]|uniref:Non-structural maintenance of chromosomes element 1 homolog n=1 Tax=Amborella trichopoda TaxID=13333 RepID=W1NTZ6_AMBTC|nr:non-structural maintenance of chromosomes element 1 homolog [Amborella trichopoda]ERM99042.1 hypothetical protein AMTR_s00101p00070200 [Amborella trichopoda]|eukprot:XP_006836189.1 non-structural maintenance of chromosomes element 1 homolog [Amborella trichopoda]
MAELNHKHHTLIQALLSRGPLKEKDFHLMFTDLTGKPAGGNQGKFNEYLLKINKQLSYVQFELRACRNQYDGDVYYGVVNSVADEQAKFGTKFSNPQIVYFKAIIEAIVQDASGQGSISNIDALNIRLEDQIGQDSRSSDSQVPAAFKQFTMSQKEKTLDDLVQNQWLCFTGDRRIGLGVRSFLDLRSWFRNMSIPSCDVCNEAGIKAESCPNGRCSVRIHDYCLRKKFSTKKAAMVCPSCETAWPVVETRDEEVGEEIGHVDPPRSSRKKLRTCKAESVNNFEAGPSQLSQPVTRRVTRSSQHLR